MVSHIELFRNIEYLALQENLWPSWKHLLITRWVLTVYNSRYKGWKFRRKCCNDSMHLIFFFVLYTTMITQCPLWWRYQLNKATTSMTEKWWGSVGICLPLHLHNHNWQYCMTLTVNENKVLVSWVGNHFIVCVCVGLFCCISGVLQLVHLLLWCLLNYC